MQTYSVVLYSSIRTSNFILFFPYSISIFFFIIFDIYSFDNNFLNIIFRSVTFISLVFSISYFYRKDMIIDEENLGSKSNISNNWLYNAVISWIYRHCFSWFVIYILLKKLYKASFNLYWVIIFWTNPWIYFFLFPAWTWKTTSSALIIFVN